MTATIIPLHRPALSPPDAPSRVSRGLTFWPEDQLVAELARARLARAKANIDAADTRTAADEARARAVQAQASATVAEETRRVYALHVERLEAELARRGVR